MAVPYHTHEFLVPSATSSDVVARTSGKVITPDVLPTTLPGYGVNLSAEVSAVSSPPILGRLIEDGRWPITAFSGAISETAKSDTIQDWSQIFSNAASYAESLTIGKNRGASSGKYPLRSVSLGGPSSAPAGLIHVEGVPVDIDFAGGELIVGAEVASHSGGVFTCVGNSSLSDHLHLSNVRIDMTSATSTGTGLGGFDIFNYRTGVVENPMVYSTVLSAPSGDAIGLGGGDTGITTHNCSGFTIKNPVMIGLSDLGLYLSGDFSDAVHDGRGESLSIIGGYFYRCGSAIAGKRGLFGVIVNGIEVLECGNGVFGGTVDGIVGSEGKGWTIVNSRFNKMQGRPIWLKGGFGDVISNNHIWDYGLRISDQTFTNVATGNQIGAISLGGMRGATVTGNSFGMKEWTPANTTDTNRGPRSIILRENNGVGCTDCIVANNRASDIYGGILESAPSDENYFDANRKRGFTDGDRINGANSILVSPVTKGAWTPVLAGTTGNATTYDLQQGRWIKENGWITATGYIDLASNAGLSGDVSISGLPENANSQVNQYAVLVTNSDITHSASAYTEFQGLVQAGSRSIQLTEVGSGVSTALTSARFGGNARVTVSVRYLAATP